MSLRLTTTFTRFALTNAIFSSSAYFIINRLGRRTLLLSSLILMFPFLLLTGHFLDVEDSQSSPHQAVIPLMVIYTALYSPGAGVSFFFFFPTNIWGARNISGRLSLYSQVIPFMYSSEVFPLVHREAGMSFACFVNFAFAGALAVAVPRYSNNLPKKHFELLGIFAGLDAVAAVMVWLFMRSPESAVSLEDMNV